MSALAAPMEVRQLRDPDELSECTALYGRVFALGARGASINARLLIAIAANSGIVVGARAEDRLIGFVYSFLARESPGGPLYQYSQTAAVDAGWRGRGVGRALKLAQRQAALKQELDTVRWLFDPLHVANAHFNLDVLGGVGVRMFQRAYGDYGTAADGDGPTDRLLIDWRLQSDRARARASGGPRPVPAPLPSIALGELREHRGEVLLGVPSDRADVPNGADGRRLRTEIITQMEQLLAERLVAISCVGVDDGLAVYRFAPEGREERAR